MTNPEEEDDDSGLIKCWCGAEGTAAELFDMSVFADTCGGTGFLDCHCGGDICVCHHHGTIECIGCEDCERDDDEWDYFASDEDYDEHDAGADSDDTEQP